jgi:hypothetical protein
LEISGLPPERLDRLRALAADLRPLLPEAGGMQEVQRLLAERDVDVMDAIIVTRESSFDVLTAAYRCAYSQHID